MSWPSVLSRTRMQAISARGDRPRASGNFKKSRTRWDTHILLGSLLVFLAVGCNEARVEQPEAKARAEQEKQQAGHQVGEPPQLTVPPEALEGQAFQTTVIERRPFRDEIAATATIKPNEYRLVHLSPRIEGRAIEAKVDLGPHVKSGQALSLMDTGNCFHRYL